MTDSSSDLDRPIDEVDREEEQDEQFDFAEHRVAAVEEYRRIRGRYEAFAQAVREILVQALRAADIRVGPQCLRSLAPGNGTGEPGGGVGAGELARRRG